MKSEVRALKRWRDIAPMSGADMALSRAEETIMAKMAELDPADARYRVLEAALAFKASWVLLAEHLAAVAEQKQFKQWGYSTFAKYCAEEIRITGSTTRKLLKSYRWLEHEAPEYLPKSTEEGETVMNTRPIPDFRAVEVLADAQAEREAERVTEDAYLKLKMAAFEGDQSPAALRRELKESIPEHLRDKPVDDPVKPLRKALNASVKAIELLREWDGNDELVLQAETLRDAIAFHLPRAGDPGPAEIIEPAASDMPAPAAADAGEATLPWDDSPADAESTPVESGES